VPTTLQEGFDDHLTRECTREKVMEMSSWWNPFQETYKNFLKLWNPTFNAAGELTGQPKD
jgi:hypothetical protein